MLTFAEFHTMTKLDMAKIERERLSTNSFNENFWMANYYILPSMLSKQLPPERFNGVLNLFLALRTNVTKEEISATLVN